MFWFKHGDFMIFVILWFKHVDFFFKMILRFLWFSDLNTRWFFLISKRWFEKKFVVLCVEWRSTWQAPDNFNKIWASDPLHNGFLAFVRLLQKKPEVVKTNKKDCQKAAERFSILDFFRFFYKHMKLSNQIHLVFFWVPGFPRVPTSVALILHDRSAYSVDWFLGW